MLVLLNWNVKTKSVETISQEKKIRVSIFLEIILEMIFNSFTYIFLRMLPSFLILSILFDSFNYAFGPFCPIHFCFDLLSLFKNLTLISVSAKCDYNNCTYKYDIELSSCSL